MPDTDRRSNPWPLLIAACAILAIALGIRHSFGIYLAPMSHDNGWGREVFAFAIALQNLVWGAAQPFAGRIADRYGAGRAVALGSMFYVAGLVGMATISSASGFILVSGLLLGIGLAGASFAVVFGAVGRVVAAEKRSMALGIAGAVGSFGQFVMLPLGQSVMEAFGWSMALLLLALLAAAMLPLSLGVSEKDTAPPAGTEMSAADALREASRHSGFWLLSLGFFVCGFQVVFIGTHLPAFLVDQGLSGGTGAAVLALVGLFNIVGSFLAGMLGARMRKGWLLSAIYVGRAIAIALFVFLPITTASAWAFGIAMGFFWLSTVPVTNAVVAGIFGVRNMSMLTGIVFFCHQIGAFLGGWLGGYVYDRLGSYDLVWLIAIVLSVAAALLNLPVKEELVARLRPA
ncbi:MFS transporter [Vineibacter terrae]|uniref:MFS transporter n=1 Tax=Vineibacter terrae TaxID=2586908 RepID=UPI002E35F4BC|nr:MFS transporter [Vineibacter terrae]HEX2890490.1 MFS transporter [Vineibacter terrae]